jgi:hypothetical protein
MRCANYDKAFLNDLPWAGETMCGEDDNIFLYNEHSD